MSTVILLLGCQNKTEGLNRSDELLRELTRSSEPQGVAVNTTDSETIANRATELLRLNVEEGTIKGAVDEKEIDPQRAAPSSLRSDAVLKIDSVPDISSSSELIEDDPSSPWMFDLSTPILSWEVLYKGNAPIGYTARKTTSTNRGVDSLVTNELRSVVRFTRDGQYQRQEYTLTSIERANGELVSLTARTVSNENNQNLVVRIEGAKAILELVANGTKQRAEIVWESQIRGPFAIEQSIMRKPLRDNESRLVRFLDPIAARIVEAKLDAREKYKSPTMLGKSKLLREISVSNQAGEAISESILWSDEDGVLLKTYIPATDIRTFQVEQDTYKDVESDFDLSLVSSKQIAFLVEPQRLDLYSAALAKESQLTYKMQMSKSDPYKLISNRCNQRVRSLNAFTAEVTLFRLQDREELPLGIDASDKPISADSSLADWLDLSKPAVSSLLDQSIPTDSSLVGHERVVAIAEALSQRYVSEEFSNQVRKLHLALPTNRLNSVEQSMALIAVLRKQKIPARLVLGYAFDSSNANPTMSFRAWVEYYYADWWWPIDPVKPTNSGMLDRVKLKEISRLETDLRREITKLISLGSEATIAFEN
ncbi:transglutaminase-like domain-containing protein [Pirellulaceae bacterium SH449]